MNAGRISPVAPPGSLLRGPKGRQKDDKYLAMIRRCPCLTCDTDPAGEASHLRASAPDKPVTGVGIKPDDRWALPLCHPCHMASHRLGERRFWALHKLDPYAICVTLRMSSNIEIMRLAVFNAKESKVRSKK